MPFGKTGSEVILGSIVAMLTAAQAIGGQPDATSPVPSDSEIRKILADRVDRFLPGVGIVVGVIEPGGRRIVSYGSAGDNDRALTGDTLFEIGSITKVFTSLLLADMVQRREVALSDPVANYLPQGTRIPERKGRRITLQDLAMHISGLPRDAPPKAADDWYLFYSPAQIYDFLAGYQLPRDIGSKWEYSNLGVGLLGHALALRLGKSLDMLFTERITGPLGMNSSRITLTPELRARLATGHIFCGPPSPYKEPGPWAAMGDLKSSANDMLTFLSAFLTDTNTPLAPAIASMLNVVRVPIHDGMEQVLGWQTGWPWRGPGRPEKAIVSHVGSRQGFTSFAGFNQTTRTGVIVLTNHHSIDAEDVGNHLLDSRFPLKRDKELTPPRQRQEFAIDSELLDRYVGQYQFPEARATVTREGDHLLLKADDDPFPAPYHAESPRDFFSEFHDAQLSFHTDDQGRVSGFAFHFGGKTRQVKRIN